MRHPVPLYSYLFVTGAYSEASLPSFVDFRQAAGEEESAQNVSRPVVRSYSLLIRILIALVPSLSPLTFHKLIGETKMGFQSLSYGIQFTNLRYFISLSVRVSYTLIIRYQYFLPDSESLFIVPSGFRQFSKFPKVPSRYKQTALRNRYLPLQSILTHLTLENQM